MKRRILAACLTALAVASAQAAEPAGPRAFLKSKSVGTVFLYADAYRGRKAIVSQPERYRRLHASGLKVYALLGSAPPAHRALRAAGLPRRGGGHEGQRKPVSRHLQDIYDYVALMDYRDHTDGGDGLVSHALDELRYGESIARPVPIGIETLPNEIRKVSFHHLGEADLERELAAASRSVGGMRSFGGFVVHHYAAYRRWLGLD